MLRTKVIPLASLALCLLFCGAVSAAEEKTPKPDETAASRPKPEYLVMKDGKIMQFPNGTKLSTDGNMVLKDGTKKKLENGEKIRMDGTMRAMNRQAP